MGLLSWWRGDKAKNNAQSKSQSQSPPPPPPPPAATESLPGMYGAEEVQRQLPEIGKITIFEFGSVSATADKVTLAGYCPVSDDLEPCRWEILPAAAADAPQFRVAF